MKSLSYIISEDVGLETRSTFKIKIITIILRSINSIKGE